jgi:hypothetical protein
MYAHYSPSCLTLTTSSGCFRACTTDEFCETYKLSKCTVDTKSQYLMCKPFLTCVTKLTKLIKATFNLHVPNILFLLSRTTDYVQALDSKLALSVHTERGINIIVD